MSLPAPLGGPVQVPPARLLSSHGQRGADTGGPDVGLLANLVRLVAPATRSCSWGGHGRLPQEARDWTHGQLREGTMNLLAKLGLVLVLIASSRKPSRAR